MAATEVRTTLWARAWAANVSDHLRMAETDVLVSDFCLFGALAAGEASGLPTAAIVHNAFHPHASGLPAKGLGRKPAHSPLEKVNQAAWQWMYYRIWARDGSPMLNQARADLGLPALRSPFHQYDYATRVLILGSREFDFPARLQSNVRYVGTPIDDANVPSDSWKSPWPEDTRTPLVLVSLSTLNQGQGPLLHRILEALDGMSVHAIVTLGPSMDKEQFRPPSNTVLETFVPHSAILPHVEAMVTQCGLGSMTKALSCGVPLVCIPVIGEQRDNAVRVEAKGAGIRLDAGASSDQIREAIKRIITEENFRMAARELASRMTTGQAAENAACEELEAIALLTARKAAQS